MDLSIQEVGAAQVEKVATGLVFAEGPIWSMQDVLFYTDTGTNRLYSTARGERFGAAFVETNGASGLAYDRDENLYTCETSTRQVTRTDKTGKVAVIADRFEGKRLNAPNDIVVREDGNVFFTDPAFGNQLDTMELDFHGVYRISPQGMLTAIARWQSRPNGIALSPNDRTLYVSSADEQVIYAFDLDRAGAASNPRKLISGIKGVPGGIAVDEAGNLYIAARGIEIYTPAGQPIRTIALDEPASNLAFGDPDFATLFVTARTSVYRIRLGVRGAIPYFRP